jgi:hypothetical protein
MKSLTSRKEWHLEIHHFRILLNPFCSSMILATCFEATKELLVLLTGIGLLAYIHREFHLATEQLVRPFHLNPASRYPCIFLDLDDHVTFGQLFSSGDFSSTQLPASSTHTASGIIGNGHKG